MHVMNKHVIVSSMPRHSGEKSFSVCRGRFAFKETLFSIALFSLCSLIVAWKSLDLLLSPLHINRINQRSRSSCHPPQ